MRGQYEFKEAENRIIQKAGLWAMLLAIAMFVQATANLLGSQNVLAAAVDAVVGVFYLLGALALRKVVATQGNDVALMLSALKKLGVAFMIRSIVMLIAAALVVTVGIIVLLVVVAV